MTQAEKIIIKPQDISIPKWYDKNIAEFLRSSIFHEYKKKALEIKKRINEKFADEIERITNEIGKNYPSVYLRPGAKYVDVYMYTSRKYYSLKVDMGDRKYPAINSDMKLMNTNVEASTFDINKNDALKLYNGNMAYSSMSINVHDDNERLKNIIQYYSYLDNVRDDKIMLIGSDAIWRGFRTSEGQYQFNSYTGTSEEIEFTQKVVKEHIEKNCAELENSIIKGLSRIEEYGGFSSVLKESEE